MIHVTAAESGDGAIFDISFEDCQLLSAAVTEVLDIVDSADFAARTGFQPHSYDHLFVWMGENQPDAAQRLAQGGRADILASLKSEAGPPTASELLLATKMGDSDTPTVRWKLSHDALRMLDAALWEIFGRFTPKRPGSLEELSARTGFQVEDFRAIQQQFIRILFAIDDDYQASILHRHAEGRFRTGQISGVSSPEDMKAAVGDAIRNGDIAGVQSAKGVKRAVFYYSENPTLVILDNDDRDKHSTAFQPQYLRNYFLKFIFNQLEALPESIRPSPPANFTPQEIKPSPGRIVPPQRRQTVEDGHSE